MFDNTLSIESYQSALHFSTLLYGTRRSVVSAGEVGVAENEVEDESQLRRLGKLKEAIRRRPRPSPAGRRGG